MCHGWYEEDLISERMRLAKEIAHGLKQAAGTPAPSQGAQPAPKPRKEEQPDLVPV